VKNTSNALNALVLWE